MKKTLLILALILGVIPAFCQEKPINSITPKFNYCEIVVTSDLMKMKIKIGVTLDNRETMDRIISTKILQQANQWFLTPLSMP